MQGRLEEASQTRKQQQTEAEEAEERHQAARQALTERIKARQDIETEQKRVQQRITEINTEKVRLSARQEEIEKSTASRAGNIEKTQKALDDVNHAMAETEKRQVDAENECEKADQQHTKILQELTDSRASQEKLQAERREIETQINQSEAQLARFQAQLGVLEQAENELTGYADGAKQLLEAARKGQLSKAGGALSHRIKVDPKYEKAIIAALGDFLDAVLIQDDRGIEQALQLLTNNPGKASLMPLSLLAPPSAATVPKTEGCIGVAADLVEVEPELRPGIDLLLGQVLLVDDRKTAKRVLAGQDGYLRAVTLNGEVFHNSGIIQVINQTDASSLSRQRQRRELADKIQNNTKKIETLKGKAKKLDDEQMSLDNDIRDNESALKQAQAALTDKQSKKQSLLLEMEQVRSSINWHQDQLTSIDKEAEQARQLFDAASVQIKQLDAELVEVEESQRELSLQFTQLTLDEHQDQVTYWAKQAAVSRQALDTAANNEEERRQAVDKLQLQLGELQRQNTTLDQQITELKSHVTEMRSSEGGIGDQIIELQQLIEPAEVELKQAEEQQLELEEKEAKARQALNISERHNSQAQINLARQQETLDGLRQRIEDDFGLVAFEYDQQVSGPTPLPFGEMVQHLPEVTEIPDDLEETLRRKRMQLRRMGSINPEADQEYNEVKERFEFLNVQMADLNKAEVDIREVIAELDELMSREFCTTFEEVAQQFREIFKRLFRGGSAKLLLTDEEHPNETGVDIEARLPGKRMQRLALLSGGERAMTAVALIFALIKASPTPFCVMDEVDAALDESNIDRLSEILRELSGQTQFVIITHNRNTVQIADLIYGITLGRDTTSQTISLRLEDVDERFTE
jgi:chromosome segregation protein